MKKLAVALTLACTLAAASAQAQNAYITNSSDETVSVIDTVTNTVTATIPIGHPPLGRGNFSRRQHRLHHQRKYE